MFAVLAAAIFVAAGMEIGGQGAPVAQTGTLALTIPAARGTFVRGVVDQGESDLVVTVRDAAGVLVGTFDSRDRGPELVAFTAAAGGDYRVYLQAARTGVASRSTPVRFDAPAPADDNDRIHSAAIALGTEAKRHFDRRDTAGFRTSIELRERALQYWVQLRNDAARLATLIAIADAHFRLSALDAAEAACLGALGLSRELNDGRSTAEILNNLGQIHWIRGNISEAKRHLTEALGLWREIRFDYGRAATLISFGVLSWEAGDLDAARRYHSEALVAFRALQDKRLEAYALTNAAIVFDSLNRPREAISYLRQALPLFRANADYLAEGQALIRMARIHLAQGDHNATMRDLAAALPLARRSSDRLAEADALELRGRTHAGTGDAMRAKLDLDAARELYAAVGSRRGESNVLHALAGLFLARGDAATALISASRARSLRRDIGVKSLEAESLMLMAQASRASGDLTQALAHTEEAIAIAERVHATVFARESRISHGAALHRYHAEHVDLLVDLHRRHPGDGYGARAFEAADRAKARGLIELLRESLSQHSPTVDSTLGRRERALREEIAQTAWSVWRAADRPASGSGASPSQQRLVRLLAEHDELEAEVRRADPAAGAALHPPSVSLSRLQRDTLDEGTVLLEYFLGRQRSLVWAVTRDAMTVVDLPGEATIDALVTPFYSWAKTSARRPDPRGAGMAAALSRTLLDPIRGFLNQPRILIVADASLHYVPFAALGMPAGTGELGREREIVSLPSAATFALLRATAAGRERAPDRTAVFADPVYSPSDPRVRPLGLGRETAEQSGRRLTRLPFSRREASQIASAGRPDDTRIFLDFEASRERATSADLADYRYVHFAGHAVHDDEHPALSAIVLSLVGRDGSAQNGFLRLHDIYRLHLNADLVVLSGCSTGLGRRAGAEGLLSLSRGVLYAGARGVLLSLWDVDDAATATMMGAFYQALQSGPRVSAAAALKTAQAAVRSDRRFVHPFYWAGWTLQGVTD